VVGPINDAEVVGEGDFVASAKFIDYGFSLAASRIVSESAKKIEQFLAIGIIQRQKRPGCPFV